MGVSMTGFEALLKSIEESPDKLKRQAILKSQKLAEKVAGKARAGAPVKSGRLRNSLKSYVEVQGDRIEGGVRTDYPPAIYHEMGTGPAGAASDYPGKAEMAQPPTYRPDGWTYQSGEVATERGEPFHEWDGEKGYGGYVYTDGVPAKAFMYNALAATEDEIIAGLGDCVTEVFLGK